MPKFAKQDKEQERNDQLEMLILALSAVLAERYDQLYRDVRSFFSDDRVRDWIERGLIGRFYTQIPDSFLEAYFPDLFTEMQNGIVKAGSLEADFAATLQDWRTPMRFDATSQESQAAVNEITRSASDFLVNDIRESVDRSAANSFAVGAGAALVADNMRRDIGLTAWQQQAVENYRQEIINQERAALRRALRDEKYDRTLEAYIDGKLQLSDRKINEMVDAYREKMKLSRAQAAGQVYATGIVNGAISSFWKRAARLGLISPEKLKKYWINRGDEKVRHSHRQIPFLNAGGVQGMDAPFLSPLGAIRYPGDPSASLANRAGCRCILRVSPQ